jgi:hypothetical protein
LYLVGTHLFPLLSFLFLLGLVHRFAFHPSPVIRAICTCSSCSALSYPQSASAFTPRLSIMSVRKAHENRKKFVSYPPSSAPSELAARRPRIIEQKQSSPKQPPIAAPSRPLHHLTGLPETCQQSRRTRRWGVQSRRGRGGLDGVSRRGR